MVKILSIPVILLAMYVVFSYLVDEKTGCNQVMELSNDKSFRSYIDTWLKNLNSDNAQVLSLGPYNGMYIDSTLLDKVIKQRYFLDEKLIGIEGRNYGIRVDIDGGQISGMSLMIPKNYVQAKLINGQYSYSYHCYDVSNHR